MEYYERIQETADYLRRVTRDFNPEIGVVLGSGLGGLTDELKVVHTVYYKDIPNFPVSTVAGHKGCLLFAEMKTSCGNAAPSVQPAPSWQKLTARRC